MIHTGKTGICSGSSGVISGKGPGINTIHFGFAVVPDNTAIKTQFVRIAEISTEHQSVNIGIVLNLIQRVPKTWVQE